MFRAHRKNAALVVGTLLAAGFLARPALASGVVGTGTPDSCTEAALDTALAGGGSVTFNCGTSPYTLTVTTPKTILLDTSIDGGGLITISGGGSTLIFRCQHAAPLWYLANRIKLLLANLTIADGYNVGTGGAIMNLCTLTVVNSTFANNSATHGPSGAALAIGGAIANWYKAKLKVINSTFTNNSADDSGGAIINWFPTARLTIINSTFANNSAGALSGGAIDNWSTARLTVTNSTFANNSSHLQGGAISGGPGNLTVTTSTFANNNSADDFGGAIFNGIKGRLRVTKSTFVNNSAVGGGAIYSEYTGGLSVANSTFANNSAGSWGGGAISSDDATPALENTIVANSTAGGNCGGAIADKGHNIDSDGTCGFLNSRGSLANADPQLDPAGLANNGGPTQTIAVESGSPAINAAPCSAKTDQRGYVRPGTGAMLCTIGAYEVSSPGCPTGLTACGAMNICTNLMKDLNNCGPCGNAW